MTASPSVRPATAIADPSNPTHVLQPGADGSITIGGGTARNITTNATTTVKTGAGVLNSVSINTKGASANTATIYDNTAGSGTKLGTIDTTVAIGQIGYGVAFSTGLTVVTATGTPADITVNYR